jgi:hypothetical protein
MVNDGSRHLRPASGLDPLERLRHDLPPSWRGRLIGPGIPEWDTMRRNGTTARIRLDGLPDPFALQLAWMAHWQVRDGARIDIDGINQLASILRHARDDGRRIPASLRAMDWPTTAALQGWYYAKRWGRLPTLRGREKLRILTRFARLALIARCHDGPWWELDDWHPPLRSPDPDRGAGTGRQLRMLPGADDAPLVAGDGQVAPGHDARSGRVALVNDQRKPDAMLDPVRPVAVCHVR